MFVHAMLVINVVASTMGPALIINVTASSVGRACISLDFLTIVCILSVSKFVFLSSGTNYAVVKEASMTKYISSHLSHQLSRGRLV